MKKVVVSFLFFFLISIVSANGLVISAGNLSSIEKTYEQDYTITLNISNTEPFDFYNITFPSNDIIEINKITKLSSGQSIQVQATIKTNEDFSGSARLRGDYFSTLGQSNKTHTINIDYYDGFDVCDIDIVEGDSIDWINLVQDEIILRNADTGEDFRTILEGENFSKKFNYPQELNYYAMILVGIPFTQMCTINIQDDSGYVHSLSYDAILDFNVNINYPPTQISINIPTTDYDMDYDGEESDIFNIRNDGSDIAKNIHLSGEWFSFTENDFDLAPGDSKNIGYTINPMVYLTNDTDKVHIKNITIEGNFDRIDSSLNIFINYQNIDSLTSGGSYDPDFFRNFYRLHCLTYPNDDLCSKKIVYLNSSNRNISLSLTEETFLGLAARQAQSERDWGVYQKSDLEFKQNISNQLDQQKQVDINQTKEIEDARKSNESSSIISIFLVIFVIFLVIVAVLTVLIRKEIFKHRAEQKTGLKKLEKRF